MKIGRNKLSLFKVWLALLAVLVQCLILPGQTFAMSRASQDITFGQSICSFHEASQSEAKGLDAAGLQSGKMLFCPICQMSAIGASALLPTTFSLVIIPVLIPTVIVRTSEFHVPEPKVGHFDPSRPRGPPAFS